MTERLFTMSELTAAMSPAYVKALNQATPERALRVFIDAVTEALKALPVADDWRVSVNAHRPGSPEWLSETVQTDEGVFYRWQLIQATEPTSGEAMADAVARELASPND